MFKFIAVRRIEKARKRDVKKIKKQRKIKAEKIEKQRLEELLPKVLTISARDYCEINGKDITHYEVKGVHTIGHSPYRKDSIKDFVRDIPLEAEIVVGFQQIMTRRDSREYIASGTALIPKNEGDKK